MVGQLDLLATAFAPPATTPATPLPMAPSPVVVVPRPVVPPPSGLTTAPAWSTLTDATRDEVLDSRRWLLGMLAGRRTPIALAGVARNGAVRWTCTAGPRDWPEVAPPTMEAWEPGVDR